MVIYYFFLAGLSLVLFVFFFSSAGKEIKGIPKNLLMLLLAWSLFAAALFPFAVSYLHPLLALLVVLAFAAAGGHLILLKKSFRPLSAGEEAQSVFTEDAAQQPGKTDEQRAETGEDVSIQQSVPQAQEGETPGVTAEIQAAAEDEKARPELLDRTVEGEATAEEVTEPALTGEEALPRSAGADKEKEPAGDKAAIPEKGETGEKAPAKAGEAEEEKTGEEKPAALIQQEQSAVEEVQEQDQPVSEALPPEVESPGEEKTSTREVVSLGPEERNCQELIQEAFQAKDEGHLPLSADRLKEALPRTEELSLKGLIYTELTHLYKEMGMYREAAGLLEAFLTENSSRLSSNLVEHFQRLILYLKTLDDLLKKAEHPGLAFSRVPRLIKVRAEQVLKE